MNAFKIAVIAVVIILGIVHTNPSGAQITGVKIIPLTTTRLNEILNESPGDFGINMLNLKYKQRESGAGIEYFAIFQIVGDDVSVGNRRWYFTLDDRNIDQVYEYIAHESEYRAVIQLCINAGLCEMQPISDPDFSWTNDYTVVEIWNGMEMARIGYNVRDVESEPFFELVDYIEENFVTPALLNPVDKWWWEE